MNKLTALLLILMASPCWSAIAFVQATSCHATTGTTKDCPFTSPPSAGNLLIVACAGNSLGANLTVTDDNSDTYTLVGGTVTTGAPSGTGLSWGIWYSSNVRGDFTTVTCGDANANVGWIEMSIHEYSGAANGINPFDVGSSSSSIGSPSTTTIVSGYAQTNNNNELMFAFSPKMTSNPTVGNGTIRTNDVDNAHWATEDAILPLAVVYQSSFTITAAGNANMMSQAAFIVPPDPPPGSHTWR